MSLRVILGHSCRTQELYKDLWTDGQTVDCILLWLRAAWWRHQMKILSALLAIWAGSSSVTGELPSQRPVTRSFDVFFDLCLNKRLNKQSCGWWFETPWRLLWRHRNGNNGDITQYFHGFYSIHNGLLDINLPYISLLGQNIGHTACQTNDSKALAPGILFIWCSFYFRLSRHSCHA